MNGKAIIILFLSIVSDVSFSLDFVPDGEIGGEGVTYGYFRYPQGMAIDDNKRELHIVDNENKRIQIFALSNLKPIGMHFSNKYFYPIDLAIDPEGNSYISDYGDQLVLLDDQGVELGVMSMLPTGDRPQPKGLYFDKTNKVLVVAQAPTENGRISVWRDGKLISYWKAARPYDVWVSGSSYIFVAEWDHVAVYDYYGKLLSKISTDYGAVGITGNDKGLIFVTYYYSAQVDAFLIQTGGKVGTYRFPDQSTPSQPYSGHHFDLVYDSQGYLFATNRAKHSVSRLKIHGDKFANSSVVAADKTYDGTTTATITACNLTGVAPGDAVTCSASAANFSDANAGTGKTVTATGITLVGADAGKYTLTNTTATTTADILKAPATVTLGNLSQTYTGSPLSPSATTSPANLAFTWTGAPQTNAGSYPVTATIHEQNYQGSASDTFVIKPKPATVSLSNLSRTYTGSPLSPTVTTVPAGLSYSLSGAPQTNAGTYPVTATITNPNYTGTAAGSFVIAKATQAPVYHNAPAWVRYQQAGLLVSGFGGTGTGTFTYSATGSTACTVHPTSGALTITSGTGTCQVTVTRQGDINYLPASSAASVIQVNKALQAPLSVSANPPSITSGGPATTLSAIGGSTGGTVTYAAVGSAGVSCVISGNTLKATGSAGTCSVTGTRAGNGNYEPVSSAPLAVPVLANVAPVAVNDSFTLLVNGTSPVTVAAPGLLANDSDANRDALKLAGITPRTITLASSGGRVTLQQNGSFTYTPPSVSFSETRSFTYQATDGKLTSNTATVTLTIARRPTANADTTATALNTAKVISVLANDSATPPATLNPASLIIVTPPANGSAQANANGTVTYTPQIGLAGTNTFSYTVRDSLGSTSNPAIVTVHVPQARPDNYSVTANTSTSQTGTAASVALNDVPNISGRTFTRLSNPIRTSGTGTGTLTITSFNTSTGAFSYRLSGTQANKRGTFQFSYRMSLGGVNTAATVTISVR